MPQLAVTGVTCMASKSHSFPPSFPHVTQAFATQAVCRLAFQPNSLMLGASAMLIHLLCQCAGMMPQQSCCGALTSPSSLICACSMCGPAAPPASSPASAAAGWDEIIRLKDSLERKPAFSSSRYRILPLHSMVPAADQRRVFVRPPVGVRKIILATNIAETAITIDDVTVVINSGGCSVACNITKHRPGPGCKAQQALIVARDSFRGRVQCCCRCKPQIFELVRPTAPLPACTLAM